MNERISEIVNKSNLTEIIDECYLDRGDWKPFAEKFAELIIKECAKVADDTQFKYRNYPVSIAIEEHFDLPK